MSRTSSLAEAALLLDARIETAPVRQLHDQVTLPFKLIERVDVDDVGVIERGAGARFTVETLQSHRVVLQLFPHQLDRHQAFQNGVKRPINLPVPAGGILLRSSNCRNCIGIMIG